MNFRASVLRASIVILLLYAGCDNSTGPASDNSAKESSITGTVLDSLNRPIPGALILDQGSLMKVDTSKFDGSFNLQMQLTSDYNTTIIFILSGYFADTVNISVKPGDNVRLSIHLQRDYGSPIIPNTIASNYPAKIKFVSTTTSDLFVAEVGGEENALITYVVLDSSNFPIRPTRKVFGRFNLSFFPNTFTDVGTRPKLIPDTDSTDEGGNIHVNLISGTQAGVVQIMVSVDIGNGQTIKSQPIKISVHAGFPDQRHFTLSMQQYNFPGLDYNYVTDLMTVLVADKYSNPVAIGTSVYFNTSHGALTTGNALTDQNGFVQQTLYSAKPRPEFNDTLNMGPGWTRVYARTFGQDSLLILDSLDVLWTGMPIITWLSIPPPPDSTGSGPWEFRVCDRYEHPMSSGTTIDVTAAGAVLSGNIPSTLPDAFHLGRGITDFTFSLSKPEGTTKPLKVTISIVVTHVLKEYSIKVPVATVTLP